VASQFLRRDSRGWDEMGLVVPVAVAEVVRESRGEGPTPDRRVSCRPGAEGADVLWLWVNVEGWVSEGMMRRDWRLEELAIGLGKRGGDGDGGITIFVVGLGSGEAFAVVGIWGICLVWES
jgi:hypothetical protein